MSRRQEFRERMIRRQAVMRPATVLSRNVDGTYECQDLLTGGTFRAGKANPFDEFSAGTRVIVSPQNAARVARGASAVIQSRAPQEQRGVGLIPRGSIQKYVSPVVTRIEPETVVLEQGGASVGAVIRGFFLSEAPDYGHTEITDAVAPVITPTAVTIDIQASGTAPLGFHSLTIHGREFEEAIEVIELPYSGNYFVAIEGGAWAAVSVDGETWVAKSAQAITLNNFIGGAAYGGGRFVGVPNSTTNDDMMYTGDGDTWAMTDAAAARQWKACVRAGSRFVAVADSGTTTRVMVSDDNGGSWSLRNAAADAAWSGLAYGGGTLVAVGTDAVMVSTDLGETWASKATEPGTWRSVAYGGGRFVAVGASAVMVSTDLGETWSAKTPAQANSWWKIAFGDGVFVAVSLNGTNRSMWSDDDGETWTAQATTNDAVQWQGIAYGRGLFVAGGANVLMTSPTGKGSWTARTSPASKTWAHIAIRTD